LLEKGLILTAGMERQHSWRRRRLEEEKNKWKWRMWGRKSKRSNFLYRRLLLSLRKPPLSRKLPFLPYVVLKEIK